ncbi:MAG: hypothetical protein INR70_03610 [Parafilimonas terrae]|nr:hypothetical protein [Parafilimonas terrae]
MISDEPCTIPEALRVKAGRVGADILAEYQDLAERLRRRGRDEVAALKAVADPAERESRRFAFQLYGTAASELDDIIAEWLDNLNRPFPRPTPRPILNVIEGGRVRSECGNA